jgi:hypothetical protein
MIHEITHKRAVIKTLKAGKDVASAWDMARGYARRLGAAEPTSRDEVIRLLEDNVAWLEQQINSPT